MDFPLEKYKYYKTKENTIVAVSTYAGKEVKGYAKLNPTDEFDEEKGKKLAALRCNKKIAHKRKMAALKKIVKAEEDLNKAKKDYKKYQNFFRDDHSK